MGYKPLNITNDYSSPTGGFDRVESSCADCETLFEFVNSIKNTLLEWNFSGTIAENGYRILINQSNDNFEPVKFNDRKFFLDSILISWPAINYGDGMSIGNGSSAQIILVLKRSEYWLTINIPVDVQAAPSMTTSNFLKEVEKDSDSPTIDGAFINEMLNKKSFCKSNLSSAFGDLSVIQLFIAETDKIFTSEKTMEGIISDSGRIITWIGELNDNANKIEAPTKSPTAETMRPYPSDQTKKLVCRPIGRDTSYIHRDTAFSMNNPVVQGLSGVLLSVVIVVLFKRFVK